MSHDIRARKGLNSNHRRDLFSLPVFSSDVHVDPMDEHGGPPSVLTCATYRHQNEHHRYDKDVQMKVSQQALACGLRRWLTGYVGCLEWSTRRTPGESPLPPK